MAGPAIRAVLAAVLPYPARFRAALAAAWLPGRIAALSHLRRDPRRKAAAGRGGGWRFLRAHCRDAGADAGAAEGALRRRRPFAPEVPRKGRVALLQGCAQAVLAPSINEAAIRLLTRHGIEVVLAAGEACCGSLVHHMGREHQALAQARDNIDVWTSEIENGGLDAIIVTTSGCGTTIKDYGFMLRGDPAYAEKAARVSALARDISEYLGAARAGSAAGRDRPESRLPVRLLASARAENHETAQGLAGEALGFASATLPRRICAAARPGPTTSCSPILRARCAIARLRPSSATGADVVATGNIGCMTQLAPATGIPVVHTVELLDWAHGGPVPDALEDVREPRE